MNFLLKSQFIYSFVKKLFFFVVNISRSRPFILRTGLSSYSQDFVLKWQFSQKWTFNKKIWCKILIFEIIASFLHTITTLVWLTNLLWLQCLVLEIRFFFFWRNNWSCVCNSVSVFLFLLLHQLGLIWWSGQG